jgi:autotransporter-associated beta strand protein
MPGAVPLSQTVILCVIIHLSFHLSLEAVMNGNFLRRRALRAIAAAVCGLTAAAQGQVSGSWVSLTGGSWSVGSNWSSNPLFPDGGGTATVGIGNVALRVDVPITLDRVLFQSVRGSSVFDPIGGTGSITLSGPAVIETTLNLRQLGTFSTAGGSSVGRVHGSAGLTKTGPGLLVLSGGSYTGGTYINEGTLASGSDVYGAAGASIVLNGGVLARTSSGSLNRDISVTPASGALFLGFQGGSDTFFNGQLSGSGVFSFLGGGSLYLSADSPFTGTFRVGSGAGRAHLREGGALRSVSTIALSGTLSLVNSSGFNSNRINDAAHLLLNAGVLQLENSATLTERVGAITLGRGANYLMGSGTVAASGLFRQNRAVLFPGFGSLTLDAAPQLVGGGGAAGSTDISIVPWVYNGGLVTYRSGRLSGLASAEYLSTIPAGSITSANVRLPVGTHAPAAPATINALVLRPPTSFGTVNLTGASTITITSGVLSAGNSVIAAPIDFGDAEGLIFAGNVSISGPISGHAGLTISQESRIGSASVALSGESTYTGPTTFNDATVSISTSVHPNTPGPFGSDDAPIVLNDSSVLRTSSVTGITFARDLHVRSEPDDSTLRFPGTEGRIDFSGDVLVEGILRASSSTFSGSISGPGQIRIPSGSVTFSGNSTFSGAVWNSASLHIGSDTALGSATIVSPPMSSGNFSVSTLTAVNGPRTLPNPFIIGNLTIAGAFPTTLTGPVQLNGGVTTLSLAAAAPQATISGPISGGLLFFNGGRLFLAGNNSQYATTINSGTMTILNSTALGGASGSPPLLTSVGTLGTLELFGSLVIPPHRLEVGSASIGLHSILGNSTWSGNVVRTADTLRIAVDADTLNIAGQLDLTSGALAKLGNGSFSVGNVRTATAVTISGGTLRIRPNGTDAGVSNVGALEIAGGATPTARLALTDNSLVIDYTGPSPIDTVRAQILSGRAGGSWTGNGITGTFASSSTQALGYAENTVLGLTTFMGQPVDSTSLIITPTFYGDADLDGDVDVNDLGRLASRWQTSGHWSDGDFNYSGFVDAADLGMLASRWQSGVSTRSVPSFAEVAAAMGLPVAAPEPATAAAVAWWLLIRRGARSRRLKRR